MMDWNKQTEEVVKSWTETQKKMWDSWMQSVQPGSNQFQGTDMWRKTMETWEETVKNTMAAQAEWMRGWTHNFEKTAGLPAEAVQWAQQAQKMSEQWNEMQQELWQSWFALIKKVDPAKVAETLGEEGQKAFNTWQETAEKFMETQAEWQTMWPAGKEK